MSSSYLLANFSRLKKRAIANLWDQTDLVKSGLFLILGMLSPPSLTKTAPVLASKSYGLAFLSWVFDLMTVPVVISI